MLTLQAHPPRPQPPVGTTPYDRWVLPDGEVKAELHRTDDGFLLRFPGEADFLIAPDCRTATGWPAPGTLPDHFSSLFRHGVVPLVGNHLGGLFLHGSAVVIDGRATAFIALSRSGKTTLAAALAKAGHPILTEDVIELVRGDTGYWLQPKPSDLRLFADSAAHLFSLTFPADQEDEKQSIAGGVVAPFHNDACPLDRIYLLGDDHSAPLSIAPVDGAAALARLLPHAFVLDVEDKVRLGAHFSRIAELSQLIPCRTLDYPRQYDELPQVVAAILSEFQGTRNAP
jgi:hypothetical protein